MNKTKRYEHRLLEYSSLSEISSKRQVVKKNMENFVAKNELNILHND